MKWGKKKSSSSPSSTHNSSPSSIIDRVFPVSWLSKMKQKGGNNADEATARHRNLLGFPTPTGSSKQGRFYSSGFDDNCEDGEAYWRISFGEERIIEGRRSTGGINPLWYDDDELRLVPPSGFKSFDDSELMAGERGEELRNFNDMVLDVRKTKDKKNMEMIIDGKSRVEKKHENAVRRFERATLSPVHDSRMLSIVPCSNFSLSPVRENISIEENGIYEDNSGKISMSEESMFCKEMKVKTEAKKKMKKYSNGREYYYSRKIKAYSPRTECKIRALEEMKKARIKSKKKERKEENMFHSFAVMKSSFDPRRDFRDSMVEMIREKRIRRPEELEELLACYLTLNSDEYHDVIIDSFRLVWLEIKEACFDSQACDCRYCDY